MPSTNRETELLSMELDVRTKVPEGGLLNLAEPLSRRQEREVRKRTVEEGAAVSHGGTR